MKKLFLLLSLIFPLSASADLCSLVTHGVGIEAVEMIRKAAKAKGSVILKDTLNKSDLKVTHASLVRIQNPLSPIALFEVHVETPERVETQLVDIGYLEMLSNGEFVNIGQTLNCQE